MRLLICLLWLPMISCNYLNGLYCGTYNCYELLQTNRNASKQEIARNYRQLAKKYHPDLHKGGKAKQEAEEVFRQIARAYEVLRDDDTRADYNYMQDNPNEYYSHFYRYYRRRTNVDVRLVILLCITIISLIQYFSRKKRYEDAIKYFMTIPKYRNKALEIINQTQTSIKKADKTKLSKAELKEQSEKNIRKVIEENLDIRGAYAKPNITDVLWIQILFLPYTCYKFIESNIIWFYNFTILKKPYGEKEKLYLIRKNMKLGIHQFNGIEDSKIAEYMHKKLWIKNNFDIWKEEQIEDMKRQMADNPRYKAYRRYKKNQGIGKITFEE